MQTKYQEIVTKLFTGEIILIELTDNQSAETIRTAISKEKTKQEQELKAFEIPVENTRLSFKLVKGTNKVKLKFYKVQEPFKILASISSENQ